MTNLINLQEIAASLYQTTLDMNKSVTEMIGLDAIWCRLLPYDNGEDVIVQEYTLHQYDCPQNIKVVSNNTNYNVGNFTIDLFGIKNAETLEINIDVNTWKAVYGSDSIPQKGDFVLIPIMHRPYEVVSSTAVHTIGNKITHWKCILGEWKHTASRKETTDFHISIDELTNSQNRLFGEQISKEVADAVNNVETSYMTTTFKDEYKKFDMKSIVVENIYGKEKNLISTAYYAFKYATNKITYTYPDKQTIATYDPASNTNKWIFSCWFNGSDAVNAVGTKLSLYAKDQDYWYFNIDAKIKLEFGQAVSIHRSNQIILNGEIDTEQCESNSWIVKIPVSDCLDINKKFPKFWENGIWKLKTKIEYNLFTLQNNSNNILKIGVTTDKCISIKYNDIHKYVVVKNLNLQNWNYFALQLSPKNINVLIYEIKTDALENITDNLVINETLPINIKTFSFNSACIDNFNVPFNMTNIRLFENEYEFGEAYKQDMYSQVVRNASKLILVDTPNAPNDMSFKSPIR